MASGPDRIHHYETLPSLNRSKTKALSQFALRRPGFYLAKSREWRLGCHQMAVESGKKSKIRANRPFQAIVAQGHGRQLAHISQ
jgi:hypothetical protein